MKFKLFIDKIETERQNRQRAADEERVAAERGRRASRFDQQHAAVPLPSTPNNNHQNNKPPNNIPSLFDTPPMPPNAPPNTPVSAAIPPRGPPHLLEGGMQIPLPSGEHEQC